MVHFRLTEEFISASANVQELKHTIFNCLLTDAGIQRNDEKSQWNI